MERISLEQVKGKKKYLRSNYRTYSEYARRGAQYFTVEPQQDGFDKITYYVD